MWIDLVLSPSPSITALELDPVHTSTADKEPEYSSSVFITLYSSSSLVLPSPRSLSPPVLSITESSSSTPVLSFIECSPLPPVLSIIEPASSSLPLLHAPLKPAIPSSLPPLATFNPSAPPSALPCSPDLPCPLVPSVPPQPVNQSALPWLLAPSAPPGTLVQLASPFVAPHSPQTSGLTAALHPSTSTASSGSSSSLCILRPLGFTSDTQRTVLAPPSITATVGRLRHGCLLGSRWPSIPPWIPTTIHSSMGPSSVISSMASSTACSALIPLVPLFHQGRAGGGSEPEPSFKSVLCFSTAKAPAPNQ
ncbi:hypothetical protein PO909_023448 [Leuciscus waleckii]